MITELKEHAASLPRPANADEILLVVDYLEACNKMFECGLLGHVRISTYPNQILDNMEEGFSFLTRWLDTLLVNGQFSFAPNCCVCTCIYLYTHMVFLCTHVKTSFAGYTVTDPKGKKFLSWQTWDLMRITWFGFKEFCEDFTTRHPGYAIYPLRLTGSAVETIFSRLKFITGGHLSAVNFVTARANLLTRYDVHGQHSKEEYRNAPLYVREHKLSRR